MYRRLIDQRDESTDTIKKGMETIFIETFWILSHGELCKHLGSSAELSTVMPAAVSIFTSTVLTVAVKNNYLYARPFALFDQIEVFKYATSFKIK